MQTVTLKIDGMTCGHCVARVRSALAALPGIGEILVTIGSARVSHDPARIGISQLVEAIAAAGYQVAGEPAGERAG